MLGKKSNLVVGLTTFNNEMLRISVPALGRLRRRFVLIIHNDNPATTITKRQIRALGYHGDLHIINSTENMGTIAARFNIVSRATRDAPSAQWITFVDDDDILMDIDTPNVSPDNFAVVQNMVIVRHSVRDLLRVMANPNDYLIDDENVVLARPHIGMVGTLVRMGTMVGMVNALNEYMGKISEIDSDIDYRPPYDAIMWAMLNEYAKSVNPNAVPIYMDRVGYIAIKLDSASTKYGRNALPARAVRDHYARAVARFVGVLHTALAAPAGHDI